MSYKVSEKKYKTIKGYKPDNLDDTEYRSRVSIAMGISEKNISLIWVSENYIDYLNMKDGDYKKRKTKIDILKAKAEDKAFDDALLKIGDSIIALGNGFKQLIDAKRKENTNNASH